MTSIEREQLALQVKAQMDEQARRSARLFGLGAITEVNYIVPEGLPEPELWSEEEIEALKFHLCATAAHVAHKPEPVGFYELFPAAVDLTDPLAHIRALIIAEYPEAASATDEEMEDLFDLWQEKQDDAGRVENAV